MATARARSAPSRALALALASACVSLALAWLGRGAVAAQAEPHEEGLPPGVEAPDDREPEIIEVPPEVVPGAMAEDACSVIASFPQEGLEGTPEELRAHCEAEQQRHFIRARELADAILARDPGSYVGHYVLGYVYHYGEANFPRALYHLRQARSLFRARHAEPPVPGQPWRWHANILRELVWAHADLEQYDEQLAVAARYNELYQPRLMAELAWPFMKLRRFEDARAAATAGETSGDPMQVEIALNARCAIEFEAGDETRSYAACRAALDLRGANPDSQSAVDFTNFAEAARSVFRLEEAEEVGLEATRAQLSWYGNPYIELTELYVREARFAEALEMMRQVNPYRQRRPPHVQDADRNEARRTLSELFVVLGRGEDAVRVTTKAMLAPDRRGHNSRDPAQDLALSALLDRAARRLRAEEIAQSTVGVPWLDRASALAEIASLRLGAWSSGRQAARALSDESRLVGTFQIGRARSAVTPPWLVGELVDVLGPGVVAAAVRRARAEDPREDAPGYYDAFEAEAALSAGDPERALELAARAEERLPRAELLLHARVSAVIAQAARATGDRNRALAAFDAAMQIDPGVFVRTGATLPVRIGSTGGALPSAVASLLAWSPRFDQEDLGMRLDVEGDASRVRICFSSHGGPQSAGAQYVCTDTTRAAAEGDDAFAARAAAELHRQAFAPRVDLSQTDANGLDGANTVTRQPLESLFGVSGDE
jgi:tetratricopeptide (TPR) repeat protein